MADEVLWAAYLFASMHVKTRSWSTMSLALHIALCPTMDRCPCTISVRTQQKKTYTLQLATYIKN